MARKSGERVNWASVPGERGLYVRDYGSEKIYMLQAQVNGKRMTDTLGAMSLEDARVIREQLARNRKLGAGPQSYAEMLEEQKIQRILPN